MEERSGSIGLSLIGSLARLLTIKCSWPRKAELRNEGWPRPAPTLNPLARWPQSPSPATRPTLRSRTSRTVFRPDQGDHALGGGDSIEPGIQLRQGRRIDAPLCPGRQGTEAQLQQPLEGACLSYCLPPGIALFNID